MRVNVSSCTGQLPRDTGVPPWAFPSRQCFRPLIGLPREPPWALLFRLAAPRPGPP